MENSFVLLLFILLIHQNAAVWPPPNSIEHEKLFGINGDHSGDRYTYEDGSTWEWDSEKGIVTNVDKDGHSREMTMGEFERGMQEGGIRTGSTLRKSQQSNQPMSGQTLRQGQRQSAKESEPSDSGRTLRRKTKEESGGEEKLQIGGKSLRKGNNELDAVVGETLRKHDEKGTTLRKNSDQSAGKSKRKDSLKSSEIGESLRKTAEVEHAERGKTMRKTEGSSQTGKSKRKTKIGESLRKSEGSDFRKTSKCNLIWTAFLPGKCDFYTFSGEFGEHRMKQLRDIVHYGGSVQSNDALEYEEFRALEKGQFDASVVQAFKGKVAALDAAIDNFYKENKLVNDKMLLMSTLADEMAKSKGNVLQLLMECKLFMHNQMLEGATGAWLHFHSFMQSQYYSRLLAIHQCSTLQSPELDQMINSAIFEEHRSNRPRQFQTRPYNRTIVEGAGPIGLYSAFKFFMAGSNVLCLNDRTKYTRNRAIFFDQRWMHQLRFLLGTEFDNLFTAEEATGQINLPEYVGQTNINEMEKSLMRRLLSLERYVDQKLGNGQDRLNLRFGLRLVGVEEPKRQIRSRQNFHNAVIEGPRKNVKPVNTALDLLVCAGGANDRIREEYIGPALRRSETKYYGVVVFVKRQFGRSIFSDLTVFYDGNLVQFAPYLQDYNFDEYIDEHLHLFSAEFGTKYAKFTKQLAKKEGQKLIIRLFENKITVHIATITPALADTFFADMSQEEREAASEQHQAEIKHFRQEIEQKWAAALFRFTMAHYHSEGLMPLDRELIGANLPDGRVQFDEHPVNTTNFPLTIRAIKDAVGLIGNDNGNGSTDAKTIAIAVGDANTSPHFMTASGVSTGRMGVERATRLLRDYHRGNIGTEHELIDGMRRGLNSIQERVLQKIAQEVGHLQLFDAPPSSSFGAAKGDGESSGKSRRKSASRG